MLRLLTFTIAALFAALYVGFQLHACTAPESADLPPETSFAGFWKEDCSQNFGVAIDEVATDVYTITFCGPGGCAQTGPARSLRSDPGVRLLSPDHIVLVGPLGKLSYRRCEASGAESRT